ncbi:MAG: undecaprenyldiphospho-muramoylpentapeptide beta-N-acetylglucosaminyltransferase [Hyphomicrobiaceae bacterium]
MLAAGGTGGHLFPAFALAEELGRRGFAVDLVTDMRGDRYGTGFPARKTYQIPSATLGGRNPVAAAKTAVTLAMGVRAAMKIFAEVKPGAVVGFGGYPSFPPLIAASLKRIPSALHEQNAVLGRANRMLAKRVTAIATSFQTVKLLEGAAAAKARFTGNPVRGAVIDWAARPYRPAGPDDRFNLLVFGGSQGARFFSEIMPKALALLPVPLRARLRVTQQCRPEDLVAVTAAFVPPLAGHPSDNGIEAVVAPFFTNLPEIMAASQLVIGRAGASSVAELAVMGRPSILVPLPHALDNDQLNNARQLAESGASWCIEQKDLSPERLAAELQRLMTDPDALLTAAIAAKAQGRPDAALRLADLVESLIAVGSHA